MDDRRRFERVTLPDWAKVYVTDAKSKKLGPVRVLARGGMLVETGDMEELTHHSLTLVDESEGISREVKAVVRSSSAVGVGFEFDGLDADAAVEVGVLIGKYYSATSR
jgi:hypothetical protein